MDPCRNCNQPRKLAPDNETPVHADTGSMICTKPKATAGPCVKHPSYFADYCPRCGTAQVIR